MHKSDIGVIRGPVPATAAQGASSDGSSPSDALCPAPRTPGGTVFGVDPKKPAK